MAKEISISQGRGPLVKQTAQKLAPHIAKKAAKKSAKKAAKKAAKTATKHVADTPSGKHEVRAYGHLGRLAVLRLVEGDRTLAPMVRRLIELAESLDEPGDSKSMAELLRAAEHVAFAGAQTGVENPLPLHPALEQQIRHDYEKLQDRAEADAPEDEAAAQLQSELLLLADEAWQAGTYTPALELIRAAEALVHVKA